MCGVISNLADHIDGTGRDYPAFPAHGRWTEEDTEGVARRPIAEVADRHFLLSAVIQLRFDGDGEIDLITPRVEAGCQRENFSNLFRSGGIVKNSLELYRADFYGNIHVFSRTIFLEYQRIQVYINGTWRCAQTIFFQISVSPGTSTCTIPFNETNCVCSVKTLVTISTLLEWWHAYRISEVSKRAYFWSAGKSVFVFDTRRHHFVAARRKAGVLSMAKREQEEEAANTNAWITTYTDLMTLLLTFFVLLISISTIDANRKREALNSLIGAFGFKPGAQSVLGKEKGMNVTMGSAPMVKEKVDFEQLQNVAFQNGLDADVEVRLEKEKIIISLSKRVLFERGSKKIRPESRKFLAEVGKVFKGVPGMIELRGFADEAEVIFEKDPMQRAMYLSAERAMTVYEFFRVESRIPVKKMVAHGFGYRKKIKGLPEGEKFQDNQVEIICNYRAKIPYSLRKKPRNRNILLDFKGFLFKLKGE